MGNPTMRRSSRAIAFVAAIGIATTLSLGSAAMASATDAPVEDEGVSTIQLETAPIQEVVPEPVVETPVATAPVEPLVEAPPAPAPAPVEVVEDVAPEVVEKPAPAPPTAAVDDLVAPMTVSPYPGGNQPKCVQDPTWSYTFDGVGSGTVTASAKKAKQGDKLCDPLAVRAITYKYKLPASGNPSWPQIPVGFNDVLVDSIGTFSYGAPTLDTCRQHDIAAEFVSKGGFDALAVPEELLGPGNPFEPQFLHQALSGKGPNPTWSTTTSEGCNAPDPEVVTGTGSGQTLSCEPGSKNWAETDAVPGGVWTFTDKNGGRYVTATGEAFSGGVPGGLAYGDITMALSQSEDGDTSAYEVTPWSGVWTTVDPESLDCEEEPPVEEPWTPGSTIELYVQDCFVEGGDPVLVHGNIKVVEGEVISDLMIDGETPPGDAEVRVGPGVHVYSYQVINLETGKPAIDPETGKPLVFEGTFTVDVCENEPPVDEPPTEQPPVVQPPVVTPPTDVPPTVQPTPPGTNKVPAGKTDGFDMQMSAPAQSDSNTLAGIGTLSFAALLLLAAASILALMRQRKLNMDQNQ